MGILVTINDLQHVWSILMTWLQASLKCYYEWMDTFTVVIGKASSTKCRLTTEKCERLFSHTDSLFHTKGFIDFCILHLRGIVVIIIKPFLWIASSYWYALLLSYFLFETFSSHFQMSTDYLDFHHTRQRILLSVQSRRF